MHEVAAAVRSQEVPARAWTERALAVIEARDPVVHAFCAVDGERALAAADAIDARVRAGEDVGPLAGVPLGVKDLEDAAGFRTSMGSRVHDDDPVATADAEHVARLVAAGCVVVGKTNTPEYGWQADTSNLVAEATTNPWDPTRSAGGSSGGSGAAIAAGMVPLATGSDGGGSIRIPSALNGLSGMKPSLGRVPNGGDRAPTWLHYSTKGPMARRISDVALALDVVVGPDATDLFAFPPHSGDTWHHSLAEPRLPRSVLWSPDLGYGTVDAEVAAVCRSAVDALDAAGVEVIEVDVLAEDPVLPWAITAFSGLRRRLWAHRDVVTPGLVSLMSAIGERTAVELLEAFDAAYAINHRLVEVLHRAPILLCPTVAGATGPVGGQGTVDGEPSTSWVSFTYPFNMTGSPAGTVCAGFTSAGMPVGLQVVGPRLGDVAVLRAIAALEQLLDVDAVAPLPWA